MKRTRLPNFDGITCVICGHRPNDVWGYNAQPFAEGRCCHDCNYYKVLPLRVEQIRRLTGQNKEFEETCDYCDGFFETENLLSHEDDNTISECEKICKHCLPEYKELKLEETDKEQEELKKVKDKEKKNGRR